MKCQLISRAALAIFDAVIIDNISSAVKFEVATFKEQLFQELTPALDA